MVSTPSSGIPASSHRPEVPAPVPISTTWRACTAAATKRRAAPAPVPTGLASPNSTPRRRAASTTSGSGTNSSA